MWLPGVQARQPQRAAVTVDELFQHLQRLIVEGESVFRRIARLWNATEGAAAVEFAVWLTVLVPAVVNAVDIGLYSYARTQVTNAGQAGAQAAWTAAQSGSCSFNSTNGTSNCPGLGTEVTYAIQHSSVLGKAGSVTENTSGETQGYYCVNVTTGVLTSN